MIKNNKCLNFCNYLYIFTLCIVTINTYLSNSVMMDFGADFHSNLIFIVCVFLLLPKIIIQPHKPVGYLVTLIVLIIALVSFYKSHDIIILLDVMLVIGAQDIDYKKIVKTIFYTGLIITILYIFGSLSHIIPNLSFTRPMSLTSQPSGAVRYCLGFNYPVALSQSILLLCISYSILHYKNIKWIRIIILTILSYLVIRVTNTRMDYYCMILLVIVTIIQKEFPYIVNRGPLCFAWVSLPLMTILSLYLGYSYNLLSNFYLSLNNILENRIGYSNIALTTDKVSLFGKQIYENETSNTGYNGSISSNILKYFFIDQSMVRIAVIYGLVILLLVVIVYTYKMYKLNVLGLNFLVLLFTIIVVNSFFNITFIRVISNPFLVIVLADLNNYINDKRDILKSGREKHV